MAGSPTSVSGVSEDRLPSLLERIELREKNARRRAVLYSILPIALTVALLGYTADKVRDGEAQVKTLQEAVVDLQAQLADAEKQLATAVDLNRFVRPISYVDAKELASRVPGSESLLLSILGHREHGVGWKLGGQSPEEGFDSPRFALFILQGMGSEVPALQGESPSDASRRLFDSLPQAASPQTGDLVFYPAGYALFYFDDLQGGPFVLGMTPFGITALRPDFAEPIGYRRVQLN